MSVKLTAKGALPEVGVAEKSATGAGTIALMQFAIVQVLLPPALLAVKLTV